MTYLHAKSAYADNNFNDIKIIKRLCRFLRVDASWGKNKGVKYKSHLILHTDSNDTILLRTVELIELILLIKPSCTLLFPSKMKYTSQSPKKCWKFARKPRKKYRKIQKNCRKFWGQNMV